jgi:hypothetical protein
LAIRDGQQDRVVATAISVACPSQEVDGGSTIHADFWDPVRLAIVDSKS